MKTAAQQTMERETRVTLANTPRSLFAGPIAERTWQIRGDEFLLRGEGDHYFHYRKGSGITIERGANADLSEESLWLNGSVYSAIASLNGLLPIHASAVACNDRVVAFTAPAAGGKSTLVAGLSAAGLPMFCDDTLVLDLSDPERIVCLPGHKRLKLKPDAIELTGATPQEKVSRTVDKYYALPASGDLDSPMPLADLVFLETAETIAIEPILGADRIVRLQDDHQTGELFAAARQLNQRNWFHHLARLAQQISMTKFVRPMDRARFRESVERAAEHVRNRTAL